MAGNTYEMSTMSSTWLHIATNRSKNLAIGQLKSSGLSSPDVQFASPIFHLHLHGSTPLESLTTSDNQSKVMSTETRITVWCVVVRKASRA